MLRMPGVPYVGPPDGNWSDGEVRPPMGMVVHIAEGSRDGTVGWQKNPASRVSSYFVTGRDGSILQMLDLDLMAWTQANGNPTWIGVENEGFHTEALTPAQVSANARIFAWLVSLWPSIPWQVSNSPNTRGLGWHGMGGAAWGNHPDCPGPVNVALLPQILAEAQYGTPISRRKGRKLYLIIQPTDGAGIALAWPSDAAKGWVYTDVLPPGADGNLAASIVDAYLAAGAVDARGWHIPSFAGYIPLASIPGEIIELGDVTIPVGAMSISLSGSLSGSATPRP